MARFLQSGNTLTVSTLAVAVPPFSVSVWFMPNALVLGRDTEMLIFDPDTTSHYHTLRLMGTNTNDPIHNRTRASGSSNQAVSTMGPNGVADVWYHAAGVWSAANSRFAYFNGGNVGSNSTSLTPTAPTFFRIAVPRDLPDQWEGRIAEIGLWNVALTQANVASLSKGVIPPRVRPQNLVGYWPVLGNNSPEVDLRNRNPFTVQGTATKMRHPRVYR